jgi:hypothetical protein
LPAGEQENKGVLERWDAEMPFNAKLLLRASTAEEETQANVKLDATIARNTATTFGFMSHTRAADCVSMNESAPRPPTDESYHVELAPVAGGKVFISITVMSVGDNESQHLSREVFSDRVDTIEDALSLIHSAIRDNYLG